METKPVSRYDDAEPLTTDFADFVNGLDYTIADVQSDPQLRTRLEAEYAVRKTNKGAALSMSTLTKQTHTSGALRAAEILGTEFKASPELRLRVLAAADVISRETRDLQMLEALEALLTLAEEGPDAGFEEPLEIMAKAREAIHKARDGSR